MAQQKKGFITRLLEGKEKSEEYARSTLPTNRWQLFFDIFKGNLGKLVQINLLTALFFIPLVAVIIFFVVWSEYFGSVNPFNTLFYPYYDNVQGMAEAFTLQNELFLFLAVLLASTIASVGLAGGMYVIRNMVWTEGIFVANDFWRGVKLNYKNALLTSIFFCVVLLLCKTTINVSQLSLAWGGLETWQVVMLRISQGVSYVFLTLAVMMSLWMIALGVNYQLSVPAMFRNAFLIAIGTFPQTLFFGVIALIPFALFLIGSPIFIIIGAILAILLSFSYALLVWIDFSQWVFDKYINPKIKGAKVGRGIYNKDGSAPVSAEDSGATIEYQRTILAYGRSRLIAKPIKPIDDSLQVYELPQSFSREDLKKLRESKETIIEDSEAYVEEHKNDARYVEYNRQFEEMEKALQEVDEKKGKKRGRKLKPPKMLGQD